MSRYVLVDGEYVKLEDYRELKEREPDIVVPHTINVKNDDPFHMAQQHLHELTFPELRRFVKHIGVKAKITDTRKELEKYIHVHFELKDL